MRTFTFSTTMILVQAATLSLGLPLANSAFSSLPTRSQAVNAEIPNTEVGVALNRRSPKLDRGLAPRRVVPTVTVYAPNSQVHVVVTPVTAVAGDGVESLLNNAANLILDTIEQLGDGVIPRGWFEFSGEDNLWLTVNNANNHQTTWGVLAAAIVALVDYMESYQWGTTTFKIFDGVNEVGDGSIG